MLASFKGQDDSRAPGGLDMEAGAADVTNPPEVPIVAPAAFVSITGDQTLVRLEGELRSFVGKKTKEGELIDTWIEAVERCREEDYYAKKYWAFLNGYLNVKMA